MPLPLVHEPAPADESGPTRTLCGRVGCGDPTVNAYLLALTRYDEWTPPVPEGYDRVRREFQTSDSTAWCSYRFTDRRA